MNTTVHPSHEADALMLPDCPAVHCDKAVGPGARFSGGTGMVDIPTQSEPAASAPMALDADATSLRRGRTKASRGMARLVDSSEGDEANANTDELRTPWTILDEASQELFRAESIVSLLSLECEASEHQTCAADIAGDFLRVVQQKLREAQRMLHEAAST